MLNYIGSEYVMVLSILIDPLNIFGLWKDFHAHDRPMLDGKWMGGVYLPNENDWADVYSNSHKLITHKKHLGQPSYYKIILKNRLQVPTVSLYFE